jgi:transposase
VISDAQGIPLAVTLTAANVNDVTQLQPLVEAILPVRSERGELQSGPQAVQGDRGYDSEALRDWLLDLGIQPILGQRHTGHGSGLGKTRWVIERTLSWLHQFRRLRVRWERRADIHLAFLLLGCIFITWRFTQGGFC